MKKIIAALLAFITLQLTLINTSAVSVSSGKPSLNAQFIYGVGPNTDGYAIDYRYFSPVKEEEETEHETQVQTDEEANESETENEIENETENEEVTAKKYPLVVWIHGQSFGQYEGYQIEATKICNWTSDEYQSRFGEVGGAHIMAVRAPEDKGICWNDDLIKPLKYAIDDFILKNIETVDTGRIYIGGFSLGGMMSFKMCIAYPDMFAATFPICPHIKLSEIEAKQISDVPVWIVSGKNDMLVSYNRKTLKNWEAVINTSSVAEDCRLSTLNDVCEPDGSLAPSAHYSWIAVTNDMFSATNGSYPEMTTVNGSGETVRLSYPEGMISWLSQFASEYRLEDIDISDTGSDSPDLSFGEVVKALFMRFYIVLRNLIRPNDL